MKTTINQPQDPYSSDWPAYWAANPGMAKSVGAADADDVAAQAAADAEAVAAAEKTAADEAAAAEAADKEKLDKAALDAAINDEDWRHGLPDDLKKIAERFSSPDDAIRAIGDFRKREGQVRVPNKDASAEEVAAFHKAVGVPETADLYEFPALPEGQALTDEIKTSRTEWGERFHKLNIPKDTAKALSAMVNEDAIKQVAAQAEADKTFATEQEDALRAEWKGDDFEKNKTLANRAFAQIAGVAGLDLDSLTAMETKDGRLLMDNASMLRLFSVIGREMSEGSLGPAISDSERETIDEQITDIRAKVSAANNEGNSKLANQLYHKELALIAKRDGDKGIVGSGNRTV